MIGSVRDNPQGPGLRTRTEQGALRAGQRLDALDIDQARIDGLGRRRHGYFAEIHGGTGVGAPFAGTGADATKHDFAAAGRRGHARQAGYRFFVVLDVVQAALVNILGRQGVDRLGNVLRVLPAPGRRDDDFIDRAAALAAAIVRELRRGRTAQGGRHERGNGLRQRLQREYRFVRLHGVFLA